MKTKIVMLSLLLILGLAVPALCCDQEIRYFFGTNNEPFTLMENGKMAGFDFELFETMIKRAGCKVTVIEKQIPWARSLKMVEEGEQDVGFTASYKDERAKYAWFDLVYRHEWMALFVRQKDKNAFNVKKPEDLVNSNIKLGVTIGSTYGPTMDRIIADILAKDKTRIEYVGGNEATATHRTLLLSGRIDAYLNYPASEERILKEQKLADQITPHQMSFVNTGPLHFMMSKKSIKRETMDALLKSLNQMKTDGTIEALIVKYSKKYNLERWNFE